MQHYCQNEQTDLRKDPKLANLSPYWCRYCGESLAEMDRLVQYNNTFIWYRCSRAGCSGSWLEKIDHQRQSAAKDYLMSENN